MKRADKTERQAFPCTYCGKEQFSKFALKVHKSHCANGLPATVQNYTRAREYVR